MTAVEEMLSHYKTDNEDQYKQAFREIMQEIVLCGLSRGGFFEKAAFTGGIALRVLYGIKRFSEDLDFSLISPDRDFSFDKYLPYVKRELNANGFDIEFSNAKEKLNVKSAFIKADTYKLILNFVSSDPAVFGFNKTEKIKVKLEIDTNPPLGAQYEDSTRVLPSVYVVKSLDLPSMFALKSHALMCRSYTKGRDFYDYLWFVNNGTAINNELVKNALNQTENKEYSTDDVIKKLENTFKSVDMEEVKNDVRRFLEQPEMIDGWTNDLFINTVPDLRLTDNTVSVKRRHKGR